MKKIYGVALLVAVAVAGPASAEPETLSALFPLRAQISGASPGVCRLELPPRVMSACRADLSDLRILTTDGREIPYIVDSPEPPATSVEVRHGASPEIVSAKRSRETVDGSVTVYREFFVLALPTPPTDVPVWDLVLTVSRPEFVSRLDVTAIDHSGARTPVVVAGSAFRLPGADAERLRFPISSPGARRLEISLESQETDFLRPRFAVESSRVLPQGAISDVALTILEVRPLSDATEVILDRPRGLVPRRLAVTTSTGTFHRRVTVWDEGPGAAQEALGVGVILRIAAVAPVEVLELGLRPPRGDRMRLVIEDLDSPPLENLGFAAVMPRPVFVFSLPEGAPEVMLYYGGGRARRPHYDLEAFDPQGRMPVAGDDARRALAVLDPAQAMTATLGRGERNPDFDPSPALAFAMHPGAAIDERLFSHRRRLEVVPSTEGLSRIRLGPTDLAVLRDDLADLRLIDDEGRQWAYLKQLRARSVLTDLAIAGHRRVDRISTYELEILEGPLAVDRIEIETDAPFFDRDFTLRGRLENGGQRDLARGRLIRRAGDPRPSTISMQPMRVVALELEIEDGDDAPLDIRRVEARTSAPDVYTAVPAGTYDLLLGYPEAEAPVYELERIRSTILAVPAGDAVMGGLEPNPEFNAASRLSRSGGAQRVLLWGVLGLAVIVLVVVTLRAARREG